MKTFSPKKPGEILIVSIGFKRQRLTGETVTSCSFRAVDSLTKLEVSGVLDTGAADTSAWPWVRQRAIGGESGKSYIIEATVVTSTGRRLIGEVRLPVH